MYLTLKPRNEWSRDWKRLDFSPSENRGILWWTEVDHDRPDPIKNLSDVMLNLQEKYAWKGLRLIETQSTCGPEWPRLTAAGVKRLNQRKRIDIAFPLWCALQWTKSICSSATQDEETIEKKPKTWAKETKINKGQIWARYKARYLLTKFPPKEHILWKYSEMIMY